MDRSISKFTLVIMGLGSLLIVLLLGGVLLQKEERTLPIIPVRSIVEDYAQAVTIAKDWEPDAELVLVRIEFEYQSGVLTNHSNNLQFESTSNLDQYLEISCYEEKCTSKLNQIKYLSFLSDGFGSIPIDKILIDSVDALDIALSNLNIILDHDECKLSMVLTRAFETGYLYWQVVNSTTHGQARNSYFTSIIIDPFTGEVNEIK